MLVKIVIFIPLALTPPLEWGRQMMIAIFGICYNVVQNTDKKFSPMTRVHQPHKQHRELRRRKANETQKSH